MRVKCKILGCFSLFLVGIMLVSILPLPMVRAETIATAENVALEVASEVTDPIFTAASETETSVDVSTTTPDSLGTTEVSEQTESSLGTTVVTTGESSTTPTTEPTSIFDPADYSSFRTYRGVPINILRRKGRSQNLTTWQRLGDTYTASNGIKVSGARFGIDVSVHQGVIDWAQVKSSNLVEFAIIRAGFAEDKAKYDDSQFLNNVRGCKENGIPFGVYLYSYAADEKIAESEADHVLRLLRTAGLSPADLDYPVFYDVENEENGYPVGHDENDNKVPISNEMIERLFLAFCNKVEAAGYQAGVYSNTNWLTNFQNGPLYDRWPKWVAQYYDHLTYQGTYRLWQCDSNSQIPGIKGPVDVNFDFANKPSSSSAASTTATTTATTTDVPTINSKEPAAVGWHKDEQGWRYIRSDRTFPRAKWEHINDKWYHFDREGYMQKGWLHIGDNWYYLYSGGAMATGWVKSGKSWFFLNTDGAMATGWLKSYNKWYYLLQNGAMDTGWIKDGKDWYYATKSGAIVTNGWSQINGRWYFFHPSGRMKTGWLKSGENWYYLRSSGEMATGWVKSGTSWYYLDSQGLMQRGWLQLSDGWYYLSTSGAMCTGTQTIGEKNYTFSDSGVLLH